MLNETTDSVTKEVKEEQETVEQEEVVEGEDDSSMFTIGEEKLTADEVLRRAHEYSVAKATIQKAVEITENEYPQIQQELSELRELKSAFDEMRSGKPTFTRFSSLADSLGMTQEAKEAMWKVMWSDDNEDDQEPAVKPDQQRTVAKEKDMSRQENPLDGINKSELVELVQVLRTAKEEGIDVLTALRGSSRLLVERGEEAGLSRIKAYVDKAPEFAKIRVDKDARNAVAELLWDRVKPQLGGNQGLSVELVNAAVRGIGPSLAFIERGIPSPVKKEPPKPDARELEALFLGDTRGGATNTDRKVPRAAGNPLEFDAEKFAQDLFTFANIGDD